MELLHLRVFQAQVADQCRFALAGIDSINAALPANDQDRLWIGCQQFLVGAANVSKALWGQRGRFASEREPLRTSLGVGEDSELINVSFRNHFEHYDERIDRWWDSSANHNILDRMIGAPDMVAGFEDQEKFRIYDPESHRIIFWGEEFFIEPIASEISRIYPLAVAEASKPHWV